MIIDTHLHVWSADTDSYPFYEGRQPSSDGSVELLNKVMSAAAVDRAVIVQPIYYLYDNRYVAACLKAFPGRFSAIGLVDRQAPDAADQLERLVRQDGFSGLRIHTSRPDDPAEWAAADQDPVWERAGPGQRHLRPSAAVLTETCVSVQNCSVPFGELTGDSTQTVENSRC